MARVFVSYRRADGPYGVGWLAERLRSLDSITGVETAFHDAGLRAGDDFHVALDAEIAGSDLVIAVIGPAWAGVDGKRRARIADPDDWVVREIATAFERGTTVIPILMGGADHPLASEVHPSIAELARLHALAFDDGRDLDTIVAHIESHLSDIDRDRARLAGLEEPVEVPRLDHLAALIAGAVVAAAVGAWVGAACAGLTSPWPFDPVPGSTPMRDTTAWSWVTALWIVLGVTAGAFGVFGVALAVRVTRYVRVDWAKFGFTFVGIAAATAMIMMATQLGDLLDADPTPIPDLGRRIVAGAALASVAGLPWALCLTAPLISKPRADERHVGRRIQTLALLRDAERWGAVSVAAILTISTAVGAMLFGAALEAGQIESLDLTSNFLFAGTLSLLTILAHAAAITRLRDQQVAVEQLLADLPPRYRANALPRLIATAFDDGGWGFRVVLALPLLVGVVTTLAIQALLT